jgi:hypothetical protein
MPTLRTQMTGNLWTNNPLSVGGLACYLRLVGRINVRHAGWTGDTDGYDPSEVLAEARRVALRAAMDAYEESE